MQFYQTLNCTIITFCLYGVMCTYSIKHFVVNIVFFLYLWFWLYLYIFPPFFNNKQKKPKNANHLEESTKCHNANIWIDIGFNETVSGIANFNKKDSGSSQYSFHSLFCYFIWLFL